MSIVIETSLGDIIIDLHTQVSLAAKNFIKLCKSKFYNGALFYNVQKDYLASIKSVNPSTTIYNQPYFEDQINPLLRHNQYGVVATSNSKPHANNSDFYILLTQNAPQLDGKHTIFGQVQEGFEVLQQINRTHIDDDGRPLLNIRIKHTYILDDPFEDLPNMIYPSRSPSPNYKAEGRIEYDEKVLIEEDEEQLLQKTKQHQAKKRAVTLEMIGDIPDADMKPPENVLYVCKLNPITEEKDLEVIFSKFGLIKNCEVVRDWKTGSSLQYAFLEFETIAACEEAYVKMENVIIDERRIHVDFCQSAHQQWSLLKKAQRKKKELNLQRELAQRSKNKDHSFIESLELKKDYFHTKANNDFVIDQQELQKLQEQQLLQLQIQLDSQQQKIQQQQQLKQEKEKKEKKEKKNKKKSAEKKNKRHRKSSQDDSDSDSQSYKNKKLKDKHKHKHKSYDRDASREKDQHKKKEKEKIKELEKQQDLEKQKEIEKQIEIEKQQEKEKQKEREKEKEKEREREKEKEREKEREREKEKEKEREREREREKEKQREREREREKEKERKRKREKEKEREKQKEKEKQKQKQEEQKLKERQQKDNGKNKEKSKQLENIAENEGTQKDNSKVKSEQEKQNQTQQNKQTMKSTQKKRKSKSSQSSNDSSSSSSSSSSSDSDSSSESSSSSSSDK